MKQNRFNVAIVKLKEAIEKKRFGKIFLATTRVRWRRDPSYYKMASWRGKWISDGGVLCNQSIHHVDLLQWLVGDIKNVYSVNSKVTAPIQAEDTATAILKYKNGASGAQLCGTILSFAQGQNPVDGFIDEGVVVNGSVNSPFATCTECLNNQQ